MVPAETILKLGKLLKKVKNNSSLHKKYYKNALFKKGAKGLSIEAITNLKKIAKNSDIKKLKVYRNINFSPFLFISVLLIVFFGLYM